MVKVRTVSGRMPCEIKEKASDIFNLLEPGPSKKPKIGERHRCKKCQKEKKGQKNYSTLPVENPKKQTLQLNRRESTQLARWKSGHLRPLVYKEGAKSFPMCTRCKTEEATPQHLLNCIGKDKRSLYREPRRILELLYEHDLQDLICSFNSQAAPPCDENGFIRPAAVQGQVQGQSKYPPTNQGRVGDTAVPSDLKDCHVCMYCNLIFCNKRELNEHCQTDLHQATIMSDLGREWKFRDPPRGFSTDQYALCAMYSSKGTCTLGQQCSEAHGEEELAEWQERFSYRQMKFQQAKEQRLHGSEYAEQLIESWMQAPNPEKVMKTSIEGVKLHVDSELKVTIASKCTSRDWTFCLGSKAALRQIALLYDVHRAHFSIKEIKRFENEMEKSYPVAPHCQEWFNNEYLSFMEGTEFQYKIKVCGLTLVSATHLARSYHHLFPIDNYEEVPFADVREVCYGCQDVLKEKMVSQCPQCSRIFCLECDVFVHNSLHVSFNTSVFGTFRQSVVFDFGTKPILVQKLCVDVVPVEHMEKLQVKELLLSTTERWDSTNVLIQPFSKNPHSLTDDDYALLSWFPPPNISKFIVTQSVMEPLTKDNYVPRLHDLLYVEEMAHFKLISKYNICGYVTLVDSYLLTHTSLTSKYAQNGELYACLKLSSQISEDFAPGRLILTNCNTALVANPQSVARNKKVYEAMIEDKGKNTIYIRLSSHCVKDLQLRAETEVLLEVQFQLNRLPLCEMHLAVDKLAPIDIIFPEVSQPPVVPPASQRQLGLPLNARLNPKQKEAILAITTDISIHLPPILILGPFGTGKTFTLAESIKQIVSQSNTRVLICTHSNSAADLYIKEHLHPYLSEGHPEARPLRVYYQHRWISTVNEVVLQYCLLSSDGQSSFFVMPTREDVEKHRIIITTLSMSRTLVQLGLKKGFFTHILIDEAAQSMECETILALSLATMGTRIVLTGDHMQLSPEVYSPFAQQRNLHMSLLERLHDLYPTGHPCKILLSQNYRSHRAIINYTSELFYENNLLASDDQPRHSQFYPLSFFTAQGEDLQDINSTAYHNDAEVYEVVDRVRELKESWPAAWGKSDGNISVVTPYYDQVVRIRQVLRKKKITGVSVERVFNVQGKQFRAIVLSTVRTRHTVVNPVNGTDGIKTELDLGFLSNAKLLNTAITRAQSLVAVVGDPVSLCSVGKCRNGADQRLKVMLCGRKLWERFIQIANENNALFGIQWESLRNQLDSLELKKTYTLNPLAPEFFPRNFYQNPAYHTPQPQQQQPQQPPVSQWGAAPAWSQGGGSQQQQTTEYTTPAWPPPAPPPHVNGFPMDKPADQRPFPVEQSKRFLPNSQQQQQQEEFQQERFYQHAPGSNLEQNTKNMGHFVRSPPLALPPGATRSPLRYVPNPLEHQLMAADHFTSQILASKKRNLIRSDHNFAPFPMAASGSELHFPGPIMDTEHMFRQPPHQQQQQQQQQQQISLRNNFVDTHSVEPVNCSPTMPPNDIFEKILIIRRNIPQEYELRTFLDSPFLQLNFYLALQRSQGHEVADKFLKLVDWLRRSTEPSHLYQLCSLVDGYISKEAGPPPHSMRPIAPPAIQRSRMLMQPQMLYEPYHPPHQQQQQQQQQQQHHHHHHLPSKKTDDGDFGSGGNAHPHQWNINETGDKFHVGRNCIDDDKLGEVFNKKLVLRPPPDKHHLPNHFGGEEMEPKPPPQSYPTDLTPPNFNSGGAGGSSYIHSSTLPEDYFHYISNLDHNHHSPIMSNKPPVAPHHSPLPPNDNTPNEAWAANSPSHPTWTPPRPTKPSDSQSHRMTYASVLRAPPTSKNLIKNKVTGGKKVTKDIGSKTKAGTTILAPLCQHCRGRDRSSLVTAEVILDKKHSTLPGKTGCIR
ncbi:HELZ [Cordylochernes scorpioides]|uniref:HELZ n=1 Tax=Cordylochernes scorpioides TaxID=51811 RepID=A0ABY6LR76_9ARAC|nr:HELZ [Cordylochernes scorpioides]